jgi:hypothetical protein
MVCGGRAVEGSPLVGSLHWDVWMVSPGGGRPAGFFMRGPVEWAIKVVTLRGSPEGGLLEGTRGWVPQRVP